METNKLNIYDLSRTWFEWCFENPQIISPNHTALYFFCIEHCNRLGWKENFGLPTTMAKEAIGIHSYNTYIKTLNDLVDWGFIELIQKSKNQYSSNIIALLNYDKALDKALDRALIKHTTKQSESNIESTSSIIIQDTSIQDTNNKLSFDDFWNLYDYKKEKVKSEKKWNSLSLTVQNKIINHIPFYLKTITDKKYQKYPMSYLNSKIWEDEIDFSPKKFVYDENKDYTKEEIKALQTVDVNMYMFLASKFYYKMS